MTDGILDGIRSAIASVASMILNGLKEVFCAITIWVANLLFTIIEALLAMFPGLPAWPIQTAVDMVAVANVWLPMGTIFTLVAAFWTFRFSAWCVLWLVRLFRG